MNIVLLSAYFPPEIGSAAHLFYELGGELVRRGHRVTVLTGFPAYNVDETTFPLKYRKGKHLIEEMNGMRIIRMRSPRMPRHVPVLRGLEQVSMAWTFLWNGLFTLPKDNDIILIYSPPLFLGLTALLLRFFKGSKVIVNIQDLFPQSAIDLQVLNSKILIWLFQKIEKLIYRQSDSITVHSAGNRNHVLQCGGRPECTYEVPNLVDTQEIHPGERNNAFRSRYGIPQSEYIISFAGVIGLSQDIDTVIEAAKLTADLQPVVYYIVGDGIEKDRLVKQAAGLKNIRFLPMIPKNEYIELLQASDICLSTLHKQVTTPVVPSKILSIMAAGRPVLASMPLHGDAPKLIKESDCGISVEPNHPGKLAEAVRWMFEHPDLCVSMGTNGRRYAVRHLSLEACTSHYEQLFTKLKKSN
ncbi:MAG: glycosyltransferase family 4 protein [Bacteroidota bacterium]